MFKSLLIAALPVLAVVAQVEPSEPAPGEKFDEGADCNISWAVDPTGTWTELNIELMSGSNTQMTHLSTVATVDGTKQSTFSYKCPEVTPNAPIYFYQFSSPVAPTNLTWTGRFTIAGTDGSSTAASETTDGIAWGNGALVDPSSAVAAPPYLLSSTAANASGTTTVNATVSTSSTPNSTVVLTSSVSSSSAANGRITTASITASGNSAGSSVDSTSAPAASNTTSGAASLVFDLHSRGVQTLISLAGTALAFSAFA